VEVLKRLHFIDENATVLLKGRVACEVSVVRGIKICRASPFSIFRIGRLAVGLVLKHSVRPWPLSGKVSLLTVAIVAVVIVPTVVIVLIVVAVVTVVAVISVVAVVAVISVVAVVFAVTPLTLQINSANELILTELILENILAPYTPQEVVALLSIFVFVEKTNSQPQIPSKLADGLEVIYRIADEVEAQQLKCNGGGCV
jgi:hypothetical protein